MLKQTTRLNQPYRNLTVLEALERRELFSGIAAIVPMLASPFPVQALALQTTPPPASTAATASGPGTGLTGEYFSDNAFQQGYLIRQDPTVKLVKSAKDSATTQSNSIRWTGQISPAYSEAYGFTVISNGGIRLWVDGQLLINKPQSTGGNLQSSTKINLVAGKLYSIKLEYDRVTGAGTSVKLEWASSHQKLSVVPQKSLYPDTSGVALPATNAGLLGTYYYGEGFGTQAFERLDPTINFDFRSASPGLPIAAASSFSIRWVGQIQAQYSQTYTFTTVSDDGIRLSINDQLLINDFNDHSAKTDTANISLVAGTKYDIRIEYYEDKFVATARLLWSSASQPLEVVPASAFSSTPPATAGTLTAANVTNSSVTLNWTGSTAATGYSIQQSTDGGATYPTIATAPAGAIQYVVTGLATNSSYLFRVDPFGSADTSTPSNSVAVITATAGPGSVTAVAASSTSVTVDWSDVPGGNGFVVYAAPASVSSAGYLAVSGANDFQSVGSTAAGVTTLTATGLLPGSEYDFVVRAVNAAGVLSAASAPVLASTLPGTVSSDVQVVSLATSIQLTWADVAGEDGFLIERSLTGINGWTQIGTTAAAVTTFTDTTVQPGQTYYYQIIGTNSGGDSAPSSLITTVAGVNAPASLTATGTTVTGTLLNWADVNGEDGFAVLKSSDGGNTFNPIATTAVNVTRFAVTGLTAGSPYQFEVEALNSANAASVASAVASVVTPALAPTAVATATVSNTAIVLNWADTAGETGFAIDRSPTGINAWSQIGTTATGVTTFTDSTIQSGSTYYYRVRALDAGGSSVPSSVLSTVALINAPGTITTGTTTTNGVTLSWPDVAGETGFEILQSSNGGATFTQAGVTAAGVTTFTATGLTAGTLYQFEVKALNSASLPSAGSGVDSLVTVAAAPASLAAGVISNTHATINWVDVIGETGFAIDRSLTGISGWSQIGTTASGVTTYTDSAVQAGITYYYRVRAIDTAGSSAPSSVLTAVAAVNAPASLASASTTTAGTILTWADVANEAGFAVLESTNGGTTFSQIGLTATGVTTYAVSGLTAGSTYQFETKALNSAGIASAASTPASVVTVTVAPAAVLVVPLSASSAIVSWADVVGETGFILERSPDGVSGWSTVSTLPAATLTYTDTTLSAGTSYYYRVHATDAGGTSTPSSNASVLTIPAAPVAALTGLSVSQSQVSWSAVTGASQYIVQRSSDGTNWTTASTVSSPAITATVANLATSTLYYYRVAAVNATGSSAQSAAVSQTTAPLAQYTLHNVIYGTTGTGAIYSVNVTNGTSTLIGQLPVIPQAPTRNPVDGTMYFFQAGTSNIYNWDPGTGNCTLVATDFIGSPIVRGAYTPTGTGYTIAADDNLRSIPASSQTITVIGKVTLAGVDLSTTGGTMDFSSNGVLYMLIGANLYTVSTTTGVATAIGSTTITGTPAMVFGPDGILYTTTSTGSEYSMNPTTAFATLIGNSNLPIFTGLAAVPLFTNLSITATASPSVFSTGSTAIYTVQVSNLTGDATTQPISVTTTLPTGLAFGSFSGTGWTASVTGQVVTLTYTGGVAANATMPAVTLTVAVSNSAPAAVTTIFNVSSTELDSNLLYSAATVISVVV